MRKLTVPIPEMLIQTAIEKQKQLQCYKYWEGEMRTS
jgi:hypothetical protein